VSFLHTLRVFSSPLFERDAFMHHTMHVLDAPANTLYLTTSCGARVAHIGLIARRHYSRCIFGIIL